MPSIESCVFCRPETFDERIIYLGEFATSFVSSPWFRYGHCLVIPNRHIESLDQLSVSEASAIMIELGRLSSLLDQGQGTGVMQKTQTNQIENGIKMNHMHFHIFPRENDETALFPVPKPNSFEGFYSPDNGEVISLVEKLKI